MKTTGHVFLCEVPFHFNSAGGKLACAYNNVLQFSRRFSSLGAAMDLSLSSSEPHVQLLLTSWASKHLQQPKLAAATVGIAVLLLVFFCRIKLKHRYRLPPGPRPWPIIGSLGLLSSTAHQDFQKLSQKYGPIIYLRLGSKDAIVVSSPQTAKEILKMHDVTFASRPMCTNSEIMFYGCRTVITAPYGPFWRHAKKVFTLELLTNTRIQQFQNMRKEEVLSTLHSMIDKCKDGATSVCLNLELTRLLLNNFTRMMMNKSYFGPDSSVTDKKEASEVTEPLEQLVTLSGLFVLGDYIPLLKPFDLQSKSRMRAVAKRNDKFLQRILDERRQELGSKQQTEVMDMVDVLLTRPAGKGEKPLTDEEIKGMLLSVVVAGTDSGSETVEWAMTELLKHPNLLKMAQDELDAVVGRDRLVEEADIPNLKYLRLIVKETLRLHPTGPLLVPRECMESRVVEGYHVPVKSQVFVNIYAIHRDPEVWERPLEFDPERFLLTNIDLQGKDFELLPFGAGRRLCPRKALGLVLVEYMLAVLLHACSWSLPPGVSPEDVDLAEAPGFGGHKRNPLEVIAIPRLPMDMIRGNQSPPQF